MIQQQKIKEWVEIYLKHIEETTVEVHVRDEEGYKFKSVDHFLQNFNIDAPNLAENLDLAITNNNLVVGNMYFPKGMLVEFARNYENETRGILKNLFDTESDVEQRIDEAERSFDKLLEIWKTDNPNKEDAKSFISLRFLSLLLGLRYPEKYNAVKPREWNMFCKFINEEFRIPQKTSSGKRYEVLNEHIEVLRKYISNIPEVKMIKEQLTRGLEFSDEDYHWVTQDIIYVTARVIASEKGNEKIEDTRERITPQMEETKDYVTEIMEFPLEEYLEKFIVRNWKNIDFGETLNLYIDDDGTPAEQYPTNQGFIDILATDKDNNFVVIELKKGRSNQQVVGQILAYVGWVKNNLASENQKVRGIIISTDGNIQLHDALSMVKEYVSVKYYRVDFHFEDPILQP